MSIVFENNAYKVLSFESKVDFERTYKNISCNKELFLNNSYGDNYILVLCSDTLTGDYLFKIGYCCNQLDDFDKYHFIILEDSYMLEIEELIVILDNKFNIVGEFEKETGLVNFHKLNKERMLIVEETRLFVVNLKGNVIWQKEMYDVIQDVKVRGETLNLELQDNPNIVKIKGDTGNLV